MDGFWKKNIEAIIEKSVVAIILLLDIIWLCSHSYGLYCTTMIAELLLAVYFFIRSIIRTFQKQYEKKYLKAIVAILSILVLLIGSVCGGFLSAVAVDPNVVIVPIQNSLFLAENKFEPSSYSPAEEQTTVTLENGGIYTNDYCYGTELTNSYFDVYISPVEKENKPTYFFIHGGGYVWGDKYSGDPNTKDDGSGYFNSFLEAGYNIVFPNYAFASEYLYPTPILQLNKCVKYCIDNAETLGISMDNVIFGGGSAGGNLAGMLALIYTNKKVADDLGAQQYLPAENVKACVFVSALINNEDYGIVHDPAFDWLFTQCGRAAFNCGFIKGNEIARQTNIIAHVDENYCPSYISDGNSGTFYSQAEELHAKLNELGVKNQLNLYPKSTDVLPHGYEMTQSLTCAQDNMEKVLAFLADIV